MGFAPCRRRSLATDNRRQAGLRRSPPACQEAFEDPMVTLVLEVPMHGAVILKHVGALVLLTPHAQAKDDAIEDA